MTDRPQGNPQENPQESARAEDRGITPSQTVGPFFSFCLTPREGIYPAVFSHDLTVGGVDGERIRIEGKVLDGDGAPVPDAMLEIWQADPQGRFAGAERAGNSAFAGFGRVECDAEGRYAFTTVKPGPVPGPGGTRQAPHINVNVFARGLLRQLVTRIYFSDELHNANDPILALVPGERCLTLIAHRVESGAEALYTFDIRLQGENETVFFEA
jgi:protocatechuate 3,4-dioxygenase alpha subunit